MPTVKYGHICLINVYGKEGERIKARTLVLGRNILEDQNL